MWKSIGTITALNQQLSLTDAEELFIDFYHNSSGYHTSHTIIRNIIQDEETIEYMITQAFGGTLSNIIIDISKTKIAAVRASGNMSENFTMYVYAR